MAPERVPERYWLGAPLQKPETKMEVFSDLKNPLQFKIIQKTILEEQKNSQAYDKVFRRAGNHGPATRVHRVFIPVDQHSMWIIQTCF